MKQIIIYFSILCFISTSISWTTSRFNVEFVIELWKHHDFPDPNLVVSSFAVIPPLCALALASDGSTRKEIFDSLGFVSLDEMIKEVRRNMARVKSVKKTIPITVVSSLYVDKRLQIKPSFKSTIDNLYDVQLIPVSFDNGDRVADQINKKVKKELKYLVEKDTISAKTISENDQILLVNGIYFKGFWKSPFTDAGQQKFHITETKTENKPTMTVTTKMPYIYVDNMRSQLLLIPFQHTSCSVMIILPDKHMQLSHKHYTANHKIILNNATQYMKSTLLTVTIPKLKIETTFNLMKTLKKIRIKEVFSEGNRLDSMLVTPQKLFMNQAYQKTIVNFNELGINTDEGIQPLLQSKQQKRAKIVQINRPFYFEVGCHDTPLIGGIIMNPAYE